MVLSKKKALAEIGFLLGGTATVTGAIASESLVEMRPSEFADRQGQTVNHKKVTLQITIAKMIIKRFKESLLKNRPCRIAIRHGRFFKCACKRGRKRTRTASA